jgi:hypothetical protein
MNKITLVLTLALVATMTTVAITDSLPEAEAMKAAGKDTRPSGNETRHIVCGDRLCSEISDQKKITQDRCAHNKILVERTCSGISTTSADVNTFTYDSSKKIITISLDSNENGDIRLNIPHRDRNISVFVDGEEWNDVLHIWNLENIEILEGTENIEIHLD